MPQPPLSWRYAVLWVPNGDRPRFDLLAMSSQGHRNVWLTQELQPSWQIPSVEHVLEEFYAAVLGFMEATC